jgi:integrase
MSRQQLPPGIKKIESRDRKTKKTVVRYEVTVDVGVNPETGKRQQIRRRYSSEKEARNELAKAITSATEGTFVSRSALTVEQACANWLLGKHDIKGTTKAAYTNSLAPLRSRHGSLPVQALTKEHLDQLVIDLQAGKLPGQRKGWTANSINPMLNNVSSVLSGLVEQGRLARDVAALVKRQKRPKQKLNTFTEAQVRTLLKHVEEDRLGHAWHLGLSGLRRGEIGGLRWPDINLTDKPIGQSDDAIPPKHLRIANNRVSVSGKAEESDPKTDNSVRTLPLTPALLTALRKAQRVQRAERLKLGPDYGPGTHVVCNEAGYSYHPDTLTDFWTEVCKKAGVPHIRLQDARHTCGTLMHLQGVPIVVISAWLGHADPAFTLRTYVHTQKDSLAEAAAILQRVVTTS